MNGVPPARRNPRRGRGQRGAGQPLRGGVQHRTEHRPNGQEPEARNAGGRGGGAGSGIIGFRKLQELALDDGMLIMEKLSKETFLAHFANLTSEKQLNPDWIRLIVKILAKVCAVEYKNIVLILFDKICQKDFLSQLMLHIVELGSDTDGRRKETVGDFLRDFCTVSYGMLKYIPAVACERLENLVKKAGRELDDLPHSSEYDELKKDLRVIMEKIAVERDRVDGLKAARKQTQPARGRYEALGQPPEDFRELSVFPSVDDLTMRGLPYLRRNVVVGPYNDVEHYLDVQFRLLREDFVRPLRDGIKEYEKKLLEAAAAPKKAKGHIRVNNVRIYEKVKVLGVKAEDDYVGLELAFDPDLKFSSQIKWEYSKRLMNDSLLVLSRDQAFSTVILATVCKHDVKYLQKGRVLVKLCEGSVRENLFTGDFLMVECQVFFGAYSPVLKGLKNFDENTFPLKEYLVYASNVPQRPAYLERNQHALLHVPLKSDNPASVGDSFPLQIGRLNDIYSWPSASRLGLDDSQFEALHGAVTNKLMLIQGPPGTGKTFLGLKVAALLITNRALWTSAARPRPMLVVCYTNHALDQFLSGLLPATKSIVRVGGGCKDERLNEFLIHNLRRTVNTPRELLHRIREQKSKKMKLKGIGDVLRQCTSLIKDGEGLVGHETLYKYGIVTPRQNEFFKRQPISAWLCNDLLPGDQVAELALDPTDWDLSGIEDSGILEELHEVILCVSASNLQDKTKELQNKRKEPMPALESEKIERDLRRLTNLQNSIRRGLLSTEIQPLQANFEDLPWRVTNPMRRWQIYRYWVDQLRSVFLEPAIDRIENEYAQADNVYREWKLVEDQNVMSTCLVVGMTTSCAASRQTILKNLKPSVVIVEEAAEVLEAHVVVSLTGDVEHLIMIGDHQQLRPNPAVYDLAKNYHLDVSLFERLHRNGIKCVALTTQHRMRPEIARLISPSIYPDLRNHPSVEKFPRVKGVMKNLFFLNHNHAEEQLSEAKSWQNSYEAKFISSMVKYLMQQGYDASKITVLSTYKGQQFYFSALRKNEQHLSDVRMTVVDNYQGEECDIILLSLVRSNENANVGFLKTENRVCVALSRARHGMFIVGNMANMTATDTVWRKVQQELISQNSFGSTLSLHCEVHGTITNVQSKDDFALCPQGGCTKLCKVLMACSHYCQQVCHTQDREHRNVRCTERCLKEICPQRHICPDRCYQDCSPCIVPKVAKLECGHTATMPCHRDPRQHKCKTTVKVTLACTHSRDAYCYQRVESLPCLEPCTIRMNCGHTCEKKCHKFDDPQHKMHKCLKTCGQKRAGCSKSHMCRKMCHEICEECDVLEEKELACGHKMRMRCKDDPAVKQCKQRCSRRLANCPHECKKLCFETCGPCTVRVMKPIEKCGHSQEMACSMNPANFSDCSAVCNRSLPCGHKCKLQCRQQCDVSLCQTTVPCPGKAACGHNVMVPCNKRNSIGSQSSELLKFCTEPCGKTLECEHKCAGTCGTCMQGRLHWSCQSQCERMLICGHVCKEPCAVGCPPCKQPCPAKCSHSSCGARCGEPCVSCKEPCQRRCAHGQCPKLCGALCVGEPCSLPCPLKVASCGHDCIGLCGDTCLCRECNDDKIDIFFGTEDEKDARFVVLLDCKHIVEARSMDTWMLGNTTGDSEIIKKNCPLCSTPVTLSQRYSNIIKQTAADVGKVKAKLFGGWRTIKPEAEEVRKNYNDITFPPGFIAPIQLLKKVNEGLQTIESEYPGMPKRGARNKPSLSLTEIQNLGQYVSILKGISKITNNALTVCDKTGKAKVSCLGVAEIRSFVETLCSHLKMRNLYRISTQEASDVNLELLRLDRLTQLCQLENSPNFNGLQSADKDLYRVLSKVIRSLGPYAKKEDNLIKTTMQRLAEKASVTITRQEIDMVRSAMGMTQGHWYKCPNGHPYCITECGGAMVESTCNECGAPIGGRNHQLRRDNQLASEIDGARQPAWPTMLNYGDYE